ncbi:MAG: hypothetical protein FWG91_04980 [Lachnospiraceae bacterium]|nr:hypothetical protein [Lachnospiraceae bacterium]
MMKLHLFIFILLSFQLLILTPVAFINKFLAVAICLGVIFHLAGSLKNSPEQKLFAKKPWFEILIWGLTNAYLTFAFFGFDLFLEPRPLLLVDLSYYQSDIPASDFQAFTSLAAPYFGLLYFGLGFIWTSYVLKSFLDVLTLLTSLRSKLFTPSPHAYWKKWLVLLVVIFSVLLIWLLAFSPAIITDDSFGYLSGWRHGIYNTGASPVYSFLVALVCHIFPITPKVLGVVFAQMLCFSALLATILMYFHQRWIRFKYIVPCAVLVALTPSVALHTIVIWVDLPNGMAMLWLAYVMVRIIDEAIINKASSKKQQLSFCVQLCLSLVLIFFLRANAFPVYLVMALVLAGLFLKKKEWRFLIAIGFSLILVLLIRFPAYNALSVYRHEQSDYHKYLAGLHDLNSVYYQGGSLPDQTLGKLRILIPGLDEPEAKANFQADWVRYLEYDLEKVSELTSGEFMSMYAETLLRNPAKMISSMLYRTRPYWVIDAKGYINTVNYSVDGMVRRGEFSELPELGIERKPNALTKVMYNYTMGTSLPLPSIFIWRYGIWSALMLICVTALLLQKRFIWILPFLPAAVYLVTLYLTNAWVDYRYGLPIFLTGLFLPLAVILLPSEVE